VKELLHFITSYLVDEPDKVKIETLEGQRAMILQIYVAPDDMGKVIGRNGRVAKALRELIRAAAMRDGKSAIVEIIQ
jgi:predicted RNA-binding protein YlqC (UPF0109 family)